MNYYNHFKAILFDLDGTLLDTAPDLAFALNFLLEKNSRPTIPFDVVRPLAGHGGKALIRLGFNIDETHENFAILWKELLIIYSQHLADNTQIFPGMTVILEKLVAEKIPWGIVTNKPGWLTKPLLEYFSLLNSAACIVSGDTLPYHKPHPEPLRYACKQLNCLPNESIYVGDAECDMQAAKNAGMKSVIALYGYIPATEKPESWQADRSIKNPLDLLKIFSHSDF